MPSYVIEIPGQGRFRVESPTELSDGDAYRAALASAGLEKPPDMDRRLDDNDTKYGLPRGTTRGIVGAESSFTGHALSKAGAEGWGQVMPETRATWEKRTGRTFNPYRFDDALDLVGMQMRENLQLHRGDMTRALRQYNGGGPSRWNNPETQAYPDRVRNNMGVK